MKSRSGTASASVCDRGLQEMCVVVDMHGVDFRQTVNLARFG